MRPCRFMSLDPIGFVAGDGNLYRYTHDQPTPQLTTGSWDAWIRDRSRPHPE